MARTFNGSIWGNIGDAVARDDMLRREENRQALGGLLDTAKFLEKANANRKLREGWQKYFEDKKAAEKAALDAEAAAETDDIENALALEDMYNEANAGNVFGIEPEEDKMAGSIWEPYSKNMRAGFDRAALGERNFMQTFDPNTATPEDILRAQQILVNNNFDLGKTGNAKNGVDGRWGTKSINAFNRYMGV